MSYNHIIIEERSCIHQFLNLGMSLRNIAKALKRSLSIISREKRNSSNIMVSKGQDIKYFLIKAKGVLDYIAIKINDHWLLEQMANRVTDFIAEITST